VNTAITANGPINLYGGDVYISQSMTSTAAGADILVRSTGNITSTSDLTHSTNAGDITFWGDSDGSGGGYIYINDRNTIDTRTSANRTSALTSTASGGGTITFGGGTGSTTLASGTVVPTGYAADNTGALPGGVTLGYFNGGHDSGNKFYSGGGDIVLRGKSTTVWNGDTSGIASLEGLNIDAGSNGNITLDGVGGPSGSTYTAGIFLGYWGSGGNATSTLRTNNGNISLTGLGTGGTNNRGIIFCCTSSKPITLAATGTGTVSLTGTGSTYDYIFSGANNILAASGAITLTGTTSTGALKADTAVTTIGYKAGTVVTSSTSDITITDDSLNLAAGNGLQVNTKGKLTIQPYGNNFTSLTYPITDFGVSTDVTGLTIGKDLGSTAHTDTITIGGTTSIAGPINIFAGTINVNANLSSSLANAQILLKASGDITMASGVDITTQGGRQVFWSDSDANGAGAITSYNSAANYGLFTTNGGDLVMAGIAVRPKHLSAALGSDVHPRSHRDVATRLQQNLRIGQRAAQVGIDIDRARKNIDRPRNAGRAPNRDRVGVCRAANVFANRQARHIRRHTKVSDGVSQRGEVVAIGLNGESAFGIDLQAIACRQTHAVIGDGDVAGRVRHRGSGLVADRRHGSVSLQTTARCRARQRDCAAGCQNIVRTRENEIKSRTGTRQADRARARSRQGDGPGTGATENDASVTCAARANPCERDIAVVGSERTGGVAIRSPVTQKDTRGIGRSTGATHPIEGDVAIGACVHVQAL